VVAALMEVSSPKYLSQVSITADKTFQVAPSPTPSSSPFQGAQDHCLSHLKTPLEVVSLSAALFSTLLPATLPILTNLLPLAMPQPTYLQSALRQPPSVEA
jgi:hypothetical protein